MYFHRDGVNSSLNAQPLKLVNLGSNISSTESNVTIYICKEWIAIERLLTIWKSDLINEILNKNIRLE